MSSDIRMRRAWDSDREAMLEITKDVWGGNDYLPFEWDKWLADPNGYLMVALKDKRPVGLQHLYVQHDGCCWLEGIRVASDQQGQGVAQVMFDAGVAWAQDNECSSIRLTTSSGNPASRRVVEKGGLQVVDRFQPLIATPSDEIEDASAVKVAHPGDIDALWKHLQERGKSFYTDGWTAFRLTKERLQLLLAMDSVVRIGADEIEGVAIATCFDTFTTLRIGLLTGSLDMAKELLGYLRRAASETGLDEVRATLYIEETTSQACRDSGFGPSFDFDIELWERIL